MAIGFFGPIPPLLNFIGHTLPFGWMPLTFCKTSYLLFPGRESSTDRIANFIINNPKYKDGFFKEERAKVRAHLLLKNCLDQAKNASDTLTEFIEELKDRVKNLSDEFDKYFPQIFSDLKTLTGEAWSQKYPLLEAPGLPAPPPKEKIKRQYNYLVGTLGTTRNIYNTFENDYEYNFFKELNKEAPWIDLTCKNAKTSALFLIGVVAMHVLQVAIIPAAIFTTWNVFQSENLAKRLYHVAHLASTVALSLLSLKCLMIPLAIALFGYAQIYIQSSRATQHFKDLTKKVSESPFTEQLQAHDAKNTRITITFQKISSPQSNGRPELLTAQRRINPLIPNSLDEDIQNHININFRVAAHHVLLGWQDWLNNPNTPPNAMVVSEPMSIRDAFDPNAYRIIFPPSPPQA